MENYLVIFNAPQLTIQMKKEKENNKTKNNNKITNTIKKRTA